MPEYDIVGELGRGGFGEVLLARHRLLGRLVAVKLIPKQALADPDAVARFGREALALARVEHPAVVAVYDLRHVDAGAVLLMEYVAGESLRQALDRRAIPPTAAIAILADVSDALEAAVSVGIIHRDVKPANVFLLASGRAKLGDFGIARIADPEVFRTRDGMLTGTPAYMAPESMLPEHEPDSRSDDYSFAVMAYEVLLGQLPFRGQGLSLLGQHGFVTAESPDAVVAGFPPDAARALMAGLAKDPADRLPARELVAQLRSVPAEAWPPPPTAAGPAQTAAATTIGRASRPLTPAIPYPAAPAAQYRRTLMVVAAAVVLGLTTAATVAIVGEQSAELSVFAATVNVDATDGNCPDARYVFTARIDTNGAAGELRLRWLQPDGERTATTTLDVPAEQDLVRATLHFDVTGKQPFRGSSQLEVLYPQRLTAAPVEIKYTCP